MEKLDALLKKRQTPHGGEHFKRMPPVGISVPLGGYRSASVAITHIGTPSNGGKGRSLQRDGCRDGYLQHQWTVADVEWCSATAAQWFPLIVVPPVLFQRGWEHNGFQWVLVRQDAPALVEAALDRRSNAHMVLYHQRRS